MIEDRPRILVVSTNFYPDLAHLLLTDALETLARAGAEAQVIEAPGALEAPAVIAQAEYAKRHGGGSFDGYVALGCVLRGETSHYDIVCTESARGLMDLAINHGVAVGNGILTCENEDQALARATPEPRGQGKGAGAARACLAMIAVRKTLLGRAPS